MMRTVLNVVLLGACFFASTTAIYADAVDARRTTMLTEFIARAGSSPQARLFFEQMPKGGDIHTHLRGAVYAESWIDWAAEDGLCVDLSAYALRFKAAGTCAESGWKDAAAVAGDNTIRRELINAMSMRSFVPTAGWSGHDQFFATFDRIAVAPHRLGDQLAEVAGRAGRQNILYLELMETLVLPELFPLTADVKFTGDPASDYQALMSAPFGRALPDLVKNIRTQISEAQSKKEQLLGCADKANPGCDVTIRFLHQVIREFSPQMVYAQIALGWAVMEAEPLVVGLNLVAPEDGFIALRDYTRHMQMIDHLYTTKGPQNITLHAGELALGLVPPQELRFHIRQAIEIGHAQRIGHGVALSHEDDLNDLVSIMREKGILTEVNLTSNEAILGIPVSDNPVSFLRLNKLPFTLSSDDEGVSRIDLTNEYLRFFREARNFYNLRQHYVEMREISRNSLTYSFLDGASLWDIEACTELQGSSTAVPEGECRQAIDNSEKASLQWELEERLRLFEQEALNETFKDQQRIF